MYCVGDMVFYPMHGAGTIESIEEREVQGNTQKYYVLNFIVGGMKVLVPMESAASVGLRNIITLEEYKAVLKRLASSAYEVNDNWNRRYRENLERMKSGDTLEVADVVRSLTLRELDRGLSTGERKMLVNARHILISELTLASGRSENEISQEVDSCINNG
ncbi:MAG: CarD family transcriptional regulator [Christensenellales bacterium]